MTHASRHEYARRLHRVVEYVDAHLAETLDLATLADLAHFSPYHFHRLFQAWMGETLGEYVRRRRIEVAATRLSAQPDAPVMMVALSVGFGSTEAFARAFRARFGVSATTWRKRAAEERKTGQTNRNDGQDGPTILDHDGRVLFDSKAPTVDVQLIERRPVRVAYLRYTGPYGEPLAQFWSGKVMPWIVREGLAGRPMYGIAHDNPNVTEPEKCRCDAGAEVDDHYIEVGDAQVTVIPGGRYAMTRYFGPVTRIHEAWTAMLRDWLPASGMQLDARPMFEYYPPERRYDDATRSFECDIVVPVAPL